MIDAHQHFWRIDRADCEWPTRDLQAIYRDFLPQDYREATAACGIEGSVLIQSQACDSDTDFLLDLAQREPRVKAVVAWLDFTSSKVGSRLDVLMAHKKFRGVRPMLQSIGQVDWILAERLKPVLSELENKKLTFDALIQPRHLPVIAELAKRHPGLSIVIDHGGKPLIARGELESWRRQLLQFSESGNVFCKLSGLLTEASNEQLGDDSVFKPYFECLLQVFGTGRLMWGSDWPVLGLVAPFSDWLHSSRSLFEQVVSETTGEAPALAWRKVSASNAAHFYGIKST